MKAKVVENCSMAAPTSVPSSARPVTDPFCGASRRTPPVRGRGTLQELLSNALHPFAWLAAPGTERDVVQSLFLQKLGAVAVLRGEQYVYELASPSYLELADGRGLVGHPAAQVFPEVHDAATLRALDEAWVKGAAHVVAGVQVHCIDGVDHCVDFAFEPLLDEAGVCHGFLEVAVERARAHEAGSLAPGGDSFAVVAHELRNPLAPIVNVAHILEKLSGGSEPLRGFSKTLRRQAGHMRRLIDDLLDFSRAGRGTLDLRREVVDLRNVLATALEQVAGPLRVHGHDLTVDMGDVPALTQGDAARLVQVVANMLHNAVKYTPAGGRISVRVEVAADEVALAVTDNGKGLAAEFLPHVFDPFTQAAAVAGRGENGLGLGLALVRSIVELHGGHVTVCSAGINQGSTFAFRLPRAGDLGG
jgi:signal transduction histidine kinase